MTAEIDGNMTEDGFFHTGDRDIVVSEVSLRVIGRVKELFKTGKGKYVAPVPIENKLGAYPILTCPALRGRGSHNRLRWPINGVRLTGESYGNEMCGMSAYLHPGYDRQVSTQQTGVNFFCNDVEGIDLTFIKRTNVVMTDVSYQQQASGRTGPKSNSWQGAESFDFLQPQGEEALLPADSVTWRVFKNPVAMFVGGITAVILELAEPRVCDGVWNNTTFRTDPLGRLRRTGLAAMVTVYGPHSKAKAMIAGINRMHGNITGVTAAGQAYNALDEELLNWVQATASYGFLEAYCQLVKKLSAEEKDAVYREGAVAARLYGAVGAPESVAEQEALFDAMRAHLQPTEVIEEFLQLMLQTPVFPKFLRPYQHLLVRVAVGILPRDIRQYLNLEARWQLPGWQLNVVQWTGRLADRLVIKASPAVHACRRLGLPDNYLYKLS